MQRYETVAQLAGKMLEAARHGQWDELVVIEQQRSEVLSELMMDAAQGKIPDVVADQVARLITPVLEADAEIASLAKEWQEELKGLLGSLGTERKISKAYGP
ncbi:MAG: flagellar protein FliT [Pseudomonadota bacterium]